MSLNPEKNWFGERKVTEDEKTALVRGVFDSVADKYDLMNDLMSGGLHRLWKDRLIREIRPRPGLTYLDVAGGTGDIAFRIRKAAGETAKITVCDLDEQMIRVGRNRAVDRGFLSGINWVTGNAQALPIPDESVDVYTIAFGLRNVTRIDDALKEAYRVLKPGGRFFCLEFSRVNEPLLARIYDAYSYKIIPGIGSLVAKDRDSYAYLVESIRKFPPPKELAARAGNAGFDRNTYASLAFGVVAIHESWKL